MPKTLFHTIKEIYEILWGPNSEHKVNKMNSEFTNDKNSHVSRMVSSYTT